MAMRKDGSFHAVVVFTAETGEIVGGQDCFYCGSSPATASKKYAMIVRMWKRDGTYDCWSYKKQEMVLATGVEIREYGPQSRITTDELFGAYTITASTMF